MNKSFADIAAAFDKPAPTRESNGGGQYYPFWNIPLNSQSIIRFLPDANTENPLGFMIEKHTHTFMIDGKRHVMPCLKQYGESCPACDLSAKFYKAGDKVNGSKYWKKKQHVAQALIMEDPLPANEQGETWVGKVGLIAIGYQLYNVIRESFKNGDLEERPYLYEGGTNFIIKKTAQGNHSSYIVGSKFAKRASDIPADVVALLEPIDLSTLNPPKPDRNLMQQYIDQTLDTDSPTYDEGGDDNQPMVSTAPAATANPVINKAPEQKIPSPAADPSATANAILAKIRARQQAGA